MEPKEANKKPSQQKSLTWITIVFTITLLLFAILSYYLVFLYPENQVLQLGITNATEKANFINQYRTTSIQFIATLAQILGGIAVGVGIYFAWGNLKVAQATLESNQKNAEKNLKVALANLRSDQETAKKNIEVALATLDSNIKNAQKSLEVSQEGQITERFTRAVDQLGSEKMETRLGGIYALERIANESDKDYWPIMEILTAYVRKNSGTELTENKKNTHVSMDIQAEESSIVVTQKAKKLPLDVQAILTVIGRRKYYFGAGESKRLNLSETCLQGARLIEYHLERTNFDEANLKNAVLVKTHLKQATFFEACLENARLSEAYIENAVFINAHLENASFDKADLGDVIFIKVRMECTVFRGANLENAYFEEVSLVGVNLAFANLKGAQGLTIDQLSKAKTLYDAKLDPELEDELRSKGFGHLIDNEPDE